jgi:hypothetical protein
MPKILESDLEHRREDGKFEAKKPIAARMLRIV